MLLLLLVAMNVRAQAGFTCPCTGGGANDYNVDAAGRTLTTIIGAGDLPATLPTGSCVAILGQMRVNRTYLMDDVTLRMQPGAEIVVAQPGGIPTTLTIRDSDISGCEQMWRAITVTRRILTFDNNDISDAQWAIRGGCGESPTCAGNRTLNITRSRFDRNHIGVQTRSTGNAFQAVSYTMTIHSDTFTCTGNLLPNFDNATDLPNYLQTDAYAAFDMNSSTSAFNIGSTNAAESILISSDENNGIRNGILIRRCNVDINIRNTDIIDPVGGVGTGTVNLASPEGIGILLDGSNGNPVVTITEGSTFAADRGIHSANCRFTATGNTSDEDFIAIRHNGVRPVEISDNTFTDYEFMGIRIETANAISSLLIDNNNFAHSHPVFQTPTTTPNSTAIAIIGTDGTNGGSGDKTISNNTLEIDAQDVAISVIGDARFSIESNNVAYGSGGAGFSNQQGIIYINGNDNFLYDNHIVEDINTKPGNSYSV
ncbi:MAG: hypothetical protein SH848_03970, partial [Saprospiraceae bacterium]|nr:hypothetical protein [Saprospiraceae bacterium]